MQSFLQYRRFAKHVARQYERDKRKGKADALVDNHDSESTSPSASDRHELGGTRDLEKGERSDGQTFDAGFHTETHDGLEKEELGYAPVNVGPAATRAPRGAEVPEEEMSRATTVPSGRSAGTALGATLTGINVRDRSTKEGGDGKVFVVGYEGENDIMNPHNWSFSTRLAATWVTPRTIFPQSPS